MDNNNIIAKFEFDYQLPIVCTAIHNGHKLNKIIAAKMALSEAERLYEEDPHTGYFTNICGNRIISLYSRFQVDFNRPEEGCFYATPQQAWGLIVRKNPPSEAEIEHSIACYHWYYDQVKIHLTRLLQKHDRIFVYDLHSYNHQRGGPKAEFDDPEQNPELIIGTNNMPKLWQPLVQKIVGKIRSQDYYGRSIDAQVNVKFPGGHFSRWLHNTFGEQVCCIALEFKKIFMNEWTGEVDWQKAEKLKELLATTLPVIIKGLKDH